MQASLDQATDFALVTRRIVNAMKSCAVPMTRLPSGSAATAMMLPLVSGIEKVRAERAVGAAEAGDPTGIVVIKLLLHPAIFDHILHLALSSTSSAMVKSIEAFLQGLMMAACRRMEALEGSSLQIIDTLQRAGYLSPDVYSGRVLAWLVRRTPLISRKVGNPFTYSVHLDWFFRPPQECLDHHQVRLR